MSLLNTNIGPERVQVFPQPLGTVQVPGVATSVTAFVISTSFVSAPVQIPVKLTDLATFVSTFGGPTQAGQGYYAVESYYNNAGTGAVAWVVNVGSSPAATDYIGTAGNGHGLRALDVIDVLGLVCVPGLSIDLAYLVQPALIDYTKVVRAEFGATLSTTFSLLAVPKEVTKADLDVQVVPSATIASISMNTLTLNPVSLANVKPGMIVKKAGLFISVITAVNDVAHQITVATLGSLAPTDVIEIDIPSAVNWKEEVVNDPSDAAGWYFNWQLMLDEDPASPPNSLVTIDPVGSVAGIMARIDSNTSIGGVSHAPAGIQFAGIAGIKGLQLSLSERLDAEPLRLNFINRITSFPGAGFVVFGGYTGDSGTSPVYTVDQQLIQVIRSVQFIKGSLERGLRGFLWENFSPDTQEQVERAIAAFLRNNIYLFPSGLPEAQQFQVVHVIATQSDIDVGLSKVRVLIKPNKAVRFIEVDLEFPLPTA